MVPWKIVLAAAVLSLGLSPALARKSDHPGFGYSSKADAHSHWQEVHGSKKANK